MADNGITVNMTPPHPGDFIRTEIIEELGLTITKAAEILGVRRATLSDLLNGGASLSPEMALRIEKALASAWTCCCACRHGAMPRRCALARVK